MCLLVGATRSILGLSAGFVVKAQFTRAEIQFGYATVFPWGQPNPIMYACRKFGFRIKLNFCGVQTQSTQKPDSPKYPIATDP